MFLVVSKYRKERKVLPYILYFLTLVLALRTTLEGEGDSVTTRVTSRL